jgi:hypothetical protein
MLVEYLCTFWLTLGTLSVVGTRVVGMVGVSIISGGPMALWAFPCRNWLLVGALEGVLFVFLV